MFDFLVFSNGRLPFDDLSVVEVVPYVKSGGILSPLEASMCPTEVYEKLVSQCLAVVAKDRPSFRDLYNTAVFLGASEDDGALKEKREIGKRNRSLNSLVPSSVEAKLLHTGPSIHHLENVLIPKAVKAVAATLDNYYWLDDPNEATIYEVVESFAKPIGVKKTCPRDGKPSCAYVDTLRGADNVGMANALLSYSWRYKVRRMISDNPLLTVVVDSFEG